MEEASALKLSFQRRDSPDYAPLFLGLGFQMLILDYEKHLILILITLGLLTILVIVWVHRYVKGRLFSKETLFLTATQIVFIGFMTIAIDKEHIQSVEFAPNHIKIIEKYGKLKIRMENPDAKQMNAFKAELKKWEVPIF